MSNKHLKRHSHPIKPDAWWCEENLGISIVVQHSDEHGNYIKTAIYKIRWRGIESALKRKKKK